MMEMLHVMIAGWFQVDQDGYLAAEIVKTFEVDAVRRAVGDRGEMDQPVGRSADRLQHHLRIAERRLRQELARFWALGLGHLGGNFAAGLRRTKTLGVRRRDGRAHRQRQAERLGNAGHGRSGSHHHTGADRRCEPAVDRLDLDVVHLAGAVFRPQPSAIGAGAEHLALVMADHHRPDRNHHGWQVGRDRGHDLRRQRLVAAADHDHGIHRLGADHFLGIHRHQIAQIHRGRERKTFGDRDGRKHHRHRARQHHAAFYGLDDLRHVAVAGIVVAVGVGDTDDRAVQRIVRIAHRLDEGLAQEQRKAGVAVTGQSLAKPVCHFLVSPGRVGATKEASPIIVNV